MGTIVVAPTDLQVIVHGGLLSELGLQYRSDASEVGQIVRGGTIDGEEVLLVVTGHGEVEAVADVQILVDLVLGTHVQVNLSQLSVVLVASLAILENPVGIALSLVDTQVAGEAEGILNPVGGGCGILTGILLGESQTVW